MPFNPCLKFERKLSAYMDGELPAKDQAVLGTHLGSCASCAAELRRLSAADTSLKRLEGITPSPFFAARVAAAARAMGKYHGPSWRFLRLPAPAMALMLALITINLFSFAINISAMEPSQRQVLLHKVTSCMKNPDSLINPVALARLCGDCGNYMCSCMKECNMKAGNCPICETVHTEGE